MLADYSYIHAGVGVLSGATAVAAAYGRRLGRRKGIGLLPDDF